MCLGVCGSAATDYYFLVGGVARLTFPFIIFVDILKEITLMEPKFQIVWILHTRTLASLVGSGQSTLGI